MVRWMVVAVDAVRTSAPLGVCAPGGSSDPLAELRALTEFWYCAPNVVLKFSHALWLYCMVLPRSAVVFRMSVHELLLKPKRCVTEIGGPSPLNSRFSSTRSAKSSPTVARTCHQLIGR